MNTILRSALLALLVSAPVVAGEPIDLDWLAGSWCSTKGPTSSEEHWLPAKGGLMLGVNRTITSRGAEFEFMRIEISPNGARFLGQPGGKPAVPFESVSTGPNRVTFANPQHDFPKRVHYHREGDSLRARVDDGTDGPAKAIEFQWTKCSAPAVR